MKEQAIPLNSKWGFQTSCIVYKSSLSTQMFREPSSFTELNYYRSLFWTRCFTLQLRNAAIFYLKAQSQNGVILKVIKMLTWLRGVTFDKLQLSVSLQLLQHFNILWEEGNILIWTTEQTRSKRPLLKLEYSIV